MYSKIAFKNVRKSFKDYTIYFLTLTLAVCIFYSFNSIESQKAMMEVNSSSATYVEALSSIISYVSVFVAFILGSLILYANNFLIKKRNKELGIYMTLGMSKNKISRILILETVIVGIFSLISGLIIGLIASQGLSVLVAKLFDFKMSGYTFIISTQAIIKTIMYFGIMFILVMIFNSFVISKYKIIDLLTVGRKTQEIKFKNPFVYLIAFILCVISLGVAYKLVLDVGLNITDSRFSMSIGLGVVGTVLFFFSLTGFILYVVKKNKKVYFKGLNIFVVKQINSKVNTNFVSMSVICLMLFLTIGVLSTGFSFKNALEAGVEESTPFDASAYMYVNKGDKVRDIKKSLDYMGVKFGENDKVVYYNEYNSGKKFSDIIPLNDNVKKSVSDNVKEMDFEISYIKISEYNKIRGLNNEEPINLKEDEILITSNFSKLLPSIEEYMTNNSTAKIDGKTYTIKNEEVIKHNLKTDFMPNNMLTLVVSDNLCNEKNLSSSSVNINFDKNNKAKSEQNFIKTLDKYQDSNTDYDKVGFVMGNTRDSIYEGNKGITTTILFIGIYIGIVFLISSMAILALQQLSEASDSIERYVALKRLGASRKSINKTIFTQTLVYFSIPVILALVHSVVGIKVVNDFISMFNQPDIGGSSLVTAGIFLFIYVIYFYITYSGYKNIVKNNI
ncbi:FtsX-like permease family protein [Terrisporobacter mayombei]|uniref:Bacitracin export permease protein BceB n=1 Tax=Terrisporobacter mayombei TaxID=1541 RepID=A0ABY9Q5Q4_9FIRM|nr:FtsX-like permease family protein [Terrisporobacter mayombei]MCC3868947.1 ABC transporter permease [Terrisporobacter mayombei]WMT82919.1 Bacitracin export permease protein BceB [Terrisporobacter mayombei]